MKRQREEEEDSEAQKRREIEAIEPEKSIHADGGGWRRGKIIGYGAHGTVNLAHFPTSALPQRFKGFPSEVAVKSAFTPSNSKELEAEKEVYESMAASPSVLRFFGDDVTVAEDGRRRLNVFLEYASGGNLARFLRESPGSKLLEPQARVFTRSILLGLNHIHQSDFVHRDIKPENMLVVKDGADGGFVPKIGDFGLARRSSVNKGPGLVAGTNKFFAPETNDHGIQEEAADIWALGCVAFSILTGKQQWRGQFKVSEVTVVKKRRNLSAEAKDFLLKCLTESHVDRPNAATLLNHPFITGPSEQPKQEDEERFRRSDESFAAALDAPLSEAENKKQESEEDCVILAGPPAVFQGKGDRRSEKGQALP